MKSAFLDQLLAWRPEVARRWILALHDVPAYTALGNPDTIQYLVNPTLDRLFSEAKNRLAHGWAPGAQMGPRLMEAASRCGLNPMIAFFLAGEAALVGVVRMILPRAELSETELLLSENELLRLLREIGRVEITAFCEICSIKMPSKAAHIPVASLPERCPYKTGLQSQPHSA